MHVVLVEPEIAPNTGNVARLCAATRSTLHLIEPFGFRLDDAQLKRAGMDYWQQVEWRRWPDWAAFTAGLTAEARLWFVGTTSLYGTGSSQYNRLYWPASAMGGNAERRMGFHPLGRSKSFGTSHFSDVTVQALVRLSEHTGGLIRVNSLFGEGVSPRLRKVRLGLAALGWPTNELLKHGRERILYGVPLVENLRDYSLGIDTEPAPGLTLDILRDVSR